MRKKLVKKIKSRPGIRRELTEKLATTEKPEKLARHDGTRL